MGFFKTVLRKTIKEQMKQYRKSLSNSKRTNAQKQETLAEREKREKQELAARIRAQAKEQAQQLLKILQ